MNVRNLPALAVGEGSSLVRRFISSYDDGNIRKTEKGKDVRLKPEHLQLFNQALADFEKVRALVQ